MRKYLSSGDLFDEGQWADKNLWDRFMENFHWVFDSGRIPLFAAVGNHDVGFHYAISERRLDFFHRSFSTDLVRFIEMKGNFFIFLNSMAMEGDNCRLCAEAENQLQKINRTLECLKIFNFNQSSQKFSSECSKIFNENSNSKILSSKIYSRPILLQHFPLFRKSDENCKEFDEAPPVESFLESDEAPRAGNSKTNEAPPVGNSKTNEAPLTETFKADEAPRAGNPKESDFAPPAEKFLEMRQKIDCVSEKSSEFLVKILNPRAIFDGHTHHGCFQFYGPEKIPEWTISSFSWRNRLNPTFSLVFFSPKKIKVSKCFLPTENSIVFGYQIFSFFALLFLFFSLFLRCKFQIPNNNFNHKIKI